MRKYKRSRSLGLARDIREDSGVRGLEGNGLKELFGRAPGAGKDEGRRGEPQPAGRSKGEAKEWWSRSGRVRKRWRRLVTSSGFTSLEVTVYKLPSTFSW